VTELKASAARSGVGAVDWVMDRPRSTRLHLAGPYELFTGKEDVIEAVFTQLDTVHQNIQARVG